MIGRCKTCGFQIGIINLTNSECKTCASKNISITDNRTQSTQTQHAEEVLSENVTNSATPAEKNFFGRLSNGDFGLAKTYWLYGVLVGFVVNIATKLITSIELLVIVMLAYIVYEIPVIMGIWRSANKYKGSKIWAVLSKIAVVFSIIILSIMLLAFGQA